MQIKITMRCNLTLVRMIIVTHTHTHTTGWGDIGTLALLVGL